MSNAAVRPLPSRPHGGRSSPPGRRAGKPVAEPATATATAAPRNSLTPEAWITAATGVLVDQGIDHVRVDVLASQLQVTRGSFYWHFRDREDLLRRVLQAWHEQATHQLTQRLSGAAAPGSPREPRAQLQDLISLPFRGRAAQRAARIELAIRAWARRDPMAQAAVDEADAARIGYHQRVFRALGFAAAEARARAFLLYGYEVAESLLSRQGSEAAKRERCSFVERLVLQPLAATRRPQRPPLRAKGSPR